MQLLLQGMLKGTGHFQDARRKEVKKKKNPVSSSAVVLRARFL